MLAITPMWWIMWGVFLASAPIPRSMGIGVWAHRPDGGPARPRPHHPIHAENGKKARMTGVEGRMMG